MINEFDNQSRLESVILELQKENSDLKMKLAFAETDMAKMQESVDIRYLNLILENETNILFLLDFDRKFAYASKTFLEKAGVSNFEKIRGVYYKDILEPVMAQANLMRLSGAISYAKKQSITLVLDEETDTDGVLRTYNAHVSPMIDDDGVNTGIMVLLNDITEVNNALEAAKQANLSKSKLLSTMSHEIRTPMNAIIGISDIELDGNAHSAETRESFEKINNAGKMLLGIINDILDLSKIETGKLELIPVKYDTASLINDIARLNLMRIDENPIDLIIHVSEKLPSKLYGDDLRIKQALNHILSNAVKFTEKGSITFTADSNTTGEGVELIFTVSDTGIGMSKEQLESLYDKYTAFSHDANRTKYGVGIGMTITKSLVKMMNGKISAESEPGKGTVFTLTVLQKSVEGSTAIGKEAAESLQKFKFTEMQRAKLVREHMPYGSVLIVDDMNINIFVAKGLMKPYGLTIDTALSGYEALDKIRGGNVYDIIFMDHMMPGLDGMETTKQIREENYTRPVVALTANSVVGQDEIFLQNGFDDFIAKPIDTGQLNDILNKLIRDKQTPEVLEHARLQKEQGSTAIPEKNDVPQSAGLPGSTDPLTLMRQIEGLDADSALDALSGLPELYIDTVKLTVKLLPERIEKMDNYVSTDIKAFAIEVHGLKSALKNMGAAKLGNSASQLERAAIDNKASFCNEVYPAFRAELLELEEKLKTVFPENTERKGTAEISSLYAALSEAKTAAESYDRDSALGIISEKAAFSYSTETDGALQAIISALEAFDCKGALNKIIKLEETLIG